MSRPLIRAFYGFFQESVCAMNCPFFIEQFLCVLFAPSAAFDPPGLKAVRAFALPFRLAFSPATKPLRLRLFVIDNCRMESEPEDAHLLDGSVRRTPARIVHALPISISALGRRCGGSLRPSYPRELFAVPKEPEYLPAFPGCPPFSLRAVQIDKCLPPSAPFEEPSPPPAVVAPGFRPGRRKPVPSEARTQHKESLKCAAFHIH